MTDNILNQYKKSEWITRSYTDLQLLKETGNYHILRGSKITNGQKTIIKVLKHQTPTARQIAAFKNECTILLYRADKLGIEITTVNSAGQRAIFYPDAGGSTLSEHLRKTYVGNDKIEIKEGLSIALEIAKEVQINHSIGILHKDIKPSNVIYDAKTGRVQLIDYSIASLATKEILSRDDTTVGTLGYMSPEQLGSIHKAIGPGSDQYSLGVTLYELFTNTLPYRCNDIMELRRLQMTTDPESPKAFNTALPDTLCEVIEKTISKDPSDRFRSISGVVAVIEKMLKSLTKQGNIKDVNIGAYNVSSELSIPDKLYGRNEEIRILDDLSEEVYVGREASLVRIKGVSGIGKSELARAIKEPFFKSGGYYIEGKFTLSQKDAKGGIPYSAITEAFTDLVDILLTEDQETLDRNVETFKDSLGSNGRVLTDLVPALKKIVGEQPQLAEGLIDSQKDYIILNTFTKLLECIESPLAIMLDDCQWADTKSLDWIEAVLSKKALNKILIITTERADEINNLHPLVSCFNSLKKKKIEWTDIDIGPLTTAHTDALVRETFTCTGSESTVLSKVLHDKTGGNPTYIRSCLGYYVDKEYIHFDTAKLSWSWQLEAIKSSSVTDNVAKIMVSRINELTEDTLDVLKIGACIGTRFNLNVLGKVASYTYEDVLIRIAEPLQKGILTKVSEKEVSFAHDKLEEAVNSLIDDTEANQYHKRIGLVYLDRARASQDDEYIFDVLKHLNQCVNSFDTNVDDDAEVLQDVFDYNLQAGKKLRANGAYDAALNLFKVAVSLLPKDEKKRWNKINYSRTITLYEEAVVVSYLCGDIKLMANLIAEVEKYSKDPLEKARIYEARINALVSSDQSLKSVKAALDVLPLLGQRMVPSKTHGFGVLLYMAFHLLRTMLYTTAKAFKNKTLEKLLKAPDMNDPRTIAALRIITMVASPAYHTAPNVFKIFILLGVYLSFKKGTTPASAYVYITFGLVLCGALPGPLQNIARGYKIGKVAEQLWRKLGEEARFLSCKMLFMKSNFITHTHEHTADTYKDLKEAYSAGKTLGDLVYASYSAYVYCSHAAVVGDVNLSALDEEASLYCDELLNLKQMTGYHYTAATRQFILNLIESDNPTELEGKAYSQERLEKKHKEKGENTALYTVWFSRLALACIYNKYDEAKTYIKPAASYLFGTPGMFIANLHPFYAAIAELGSVLYQPSTSRQKRKAVSKCKSYKRRLKKLAKFGPMNFNHKILIVEALEQAVKGNHLQAMTKFESAVESCASVGYVSDEAIVNELYFRYCLQQKLYVSATNNLRQALRCYDIWGAKEKYDRLATSVQDDPEMSKCADALQQKESYTHTSTTFTGTGSRSMSLDSLRYRMPDIFQKFSKAPLYDLIAKNFADISGAKRIVMFLGKKENTSELGVIAEGRNEGGKLKLTTNKEPKGSLEDKSLQSTLPIKIIRLAARESTPVVINDVEKDKDNYGYENYLQSAAQNDVYSMSVSVYKSGDIHLVVYLETSVRNAFGKATIDLLNFFMSIVVEKVKNLNLMQEREREAIKKSEIDQAKRIQTGLFPKQEELVSDHFNMTAYMEAAEKVGGDYFDYVDRSKIDGTQWFILSDVEGHGLKAGVFAMMVQTSFQTILSNGSSPTPRGALLTLNNIVRGNIRRLYGPMDLVTIPTIILKYDIKQKQFEMFGALNVSVFVYRAKTKQVDKYIHSEPIMLWLGITDNEDIEKGLKTVKPEINFGMNKGDVAVICTDGITESRNAKDAQFGEENVEKTLVKLAEKEPEIIKKGLIEDVSTWAGSVQDDDITFAIIKKK